MVQRSLKLICSILATLSKLTVPEVKQHIFCNSSQFFSFKKVKYVDAEEGRWKIQYMENILYTYYKKIYFTFFKYNALK